MQHSSLKNSRLTWISLRDTQLSSDFKRTFSDIWDALKKIFIVYLIFKFHWTPCILSGNPRPGESEHWAAPSPPVSIPRPPSQHPPLEGGRGWFGDPALASTAPCWLGSPPQEPSPLRARLSQGLRLSKAHELCQSPPSFWGPSLP